MFSQERGVMPFMDNPWKNSWRVTWNPGGMCFKIMSGTPSGPVALWFEARRRASCIIAGEIRPDIMGTVLSCDKGTRASHGNGANGVGSDDSAFIYSFSTCAMNSARSMRRRSVLSSLITARFVGRGWESAFLAVVRMMN